MIRFDLNMEHDEVYGKFVLTVCICSVLYFCKKFADCKKNRLCFSFTRGIHRLLLITIKRATMCMNQQRIKRRDMRVDGLVIELHATSIQYKDLNMPNHSLSCKCIQHQKINCQ